MVLFRSVYRAVAGAASTNESSIYVLRRSGFLGCFSSAGSCFSSSASRGEEDISGFFQNGDEGNFNSDEQGSRYTMKETIQSPIPHRALRGEKRAARQSNDYPSGFRGDEFGSGRNGTTFSPTTSPVKQDRTGVLDQQSENADPNETFADKFRIMKNTDSPSREQSFLDKFKLGDVPREDPPRNLAFEPEQRQGQSTVDEEEDSQPQNADEIFKKMKESGLVPNAVSMLDGLCKDGLVQEAMKLFGLMREKGTFPDVVVYTAVVEGFCKAKKLDDARRIFRKMQSNGISPNAFSYRILIQALYKCDDTDGALDMCIEMIEVGHSPNVATLVGLINSLCRLKGVDEAKKVIERLKQKGYFVNEKAVRDYLDRRGPFVPLVREAILGQRSLGALF